MRNLKLEDPKGFEDLEKEINTYLTKPENNKFDTPGRNDIYRTISGEEEAAYGWIAANFSLGTLSELGQLSTEKLGYLEMGGASAQIAFEPFVNELSPEQLEDGDITRITMGGMGFYLFLKTYALGADKAWEEYQKDLFRIADREVTYSLISHSHFH